MKSSRLPPTPARWLLTVGWLLAAVIHVPAQDPASTLKKVVETTQPPPAKVTPPEPPQDNRERLEQWLRDARDTLARLDAPGAAAALPAGVSAEQLTERRRDLEQMILTITRALKNLNSVTDARKDLEEARAKDAAWKGFKEKPPYSLLMVDELLNERDATQDNLTSSESSLANYERLLTSIMAETKAAEDAMSAALGALQQATGPAHEAAKWQLEAARAKSRLLAVRAGVLQSGRDSLKDRIAAAKTDLARLERQIKTAQADSSFSDNDLAKISKVSEERKLAIRKENDAISKRLNAALTARTQAQAALDALATPPAETAEPPGLDLAKFRLEVAEVRVDAMQALVEGFDSLIQLENVSMTAYQDRREILSASNPKQRDKALESLGILRERLWAWENVVGDEISDSGSALNKLESRAVSISSEDPRFKLFNEQRAAATEKLAMLQRVLQAVIFQRKLVKRWHQQFIPDPIETGWRHRLSVLGSAGQNVLKNIWSFELMSFENKVELDGETITGTVRVTLGLLLRALLFFLIGYWIASHLARRLQHSLVGRGHLADAQARTLRNWAMIVIGGFLAIGTLAFLRIPLTVFAFFGGALAIGLGFGTQTLIKNFVSGIIVLAERKVRVGDIVDVEGIVGTIIEINTRSSVIRSPDDVETMIPNSVFLDNRVTNWTLTSPKMRRNLRVGVAYGSPPQKVMEILTECAGRHGLICRNPAPFAVFEDFGDNALVFHLYFWLELSASTNAMIVTSDLRLMIEKRFAESAISVPYPQRDLHLATDAPLQVQWAAEQSSVTSH